MAKRKSQSDQNDESKGKRSGSKFNRGPTKTINPDVDILEKDRVYFEIHNLDGRLHGRIYDTIVNIRTVASSGERTFFTLSSQEWMHNDDDFMVLVLRVRGDRKEKDRELQPEFHSKNWEEDRRNHIVPHGIDFHEVSFLICKYDLFALAFRNKDKWHVLSDLSEDYKYTIPNAEILWFGCNYTSNYPSIARFGPGVLIDNIKALYGQSQEDRDKWENSFFDIVVHFLEAARFISIQNDVMEAFKVREGDVTWMYNKKEMNPNHCKFIKKWDHISKAYKFCFNGAGWDGSGQMEGKVSCVDQCEKILGIVKCVQMNKSDIDKERKKYLDKKKEQKEKGEGKMEEGSTSKGVEGNDEQVGLETSFAKVNLKTTADIPPKEKGKAIIRE